MRSRTISRALGAAARPTLRPTSNASLRFDSSSSTTTTSDPSSSTSASSSSSSTSWQPVLPPGVNPAYDAALSFLSERKSRALTKLGKFREQLQHDHTDLSPSEVQRRIEMLEVEADVNDPETRRIFRDTLGKGQMDKSVMRYLAKRRWEREGGLDLLMQRVYQMKVVPDLLPELGVTQPLTLETASTGSETTLNTVEPGSHQTPSVFSKPPRLTFQLLHHPSSSDLASTSTSSSAPTGLFTLLVVDPDSPDHSTHSFVERVHYLKTDIPLSVTSGEVDLFSQDLGNEQISWEPPVPPQGSASHRYVFIVIQQGSSSQSSESPSSSLSSTTTIPSRSPFSLREYLSNLSLSPKTDVVGINLIRSKWSQDEAKYIAQAYKEHRGEDVPVYGKPPKEMKFGYPLSAKAAKREEIRQQAWERAVQELGEVVDEAQERVVEEEEIAKQ